jgi:Zn-dependent protease/predicted transcriptional regulator
MIRTAYRLPFRLAGIPLYIDISFLIILPLMVWLTAKNLAMLVHQPQLGLDLDPSLFTGLMPLVLGLVSVIGLFVSIVLHELGHSLTARRYGVKVRRITLWFLGGVAEFEEMPRQRGAEAIVGIAGPIVSFVLAVVFWGLAAVVPHSVVWLWIVVWYLGVVNLMLGLFNLLPALPLDGGRILRSLLALKMPHAKATIIAGNIARVLAIAMGIYGLFANLWLIVLAFFIFTAVKSETQQTVVSDLLRGITVRDLMSRDVMSVPAGLTLEELSRVMLTQRHLGFPVVDEQNRLVGAIGLAQMQNADPRRAVGEVMLRNPPTVAPDADAVRALERMAREQADRLIVVDETGGMIGIVTQADLMRALQVRMTGVAPQPPHEASSPYAQRPAGHFPPSPAPEVFGYTPNHAARHPQ